MRSVRRQLRAGGIILLLLLLALLGALQWAQRPTTDLTIHPIVTVRDYLPLERVTAYNAVPSQTDADPELSACGPTRPGQVAVSRDLLHEIVPCGTAVLIVTDDGWLIRGIVNDTMHARWSHTADVLMDKLVEARGFGVQSGHLILD